MSKNAIIKVYSRTLLVFNKLLLIISALRNCVTIIYTVILYKVLNIYLTNLKITNLISLNSINTRGNLIIKSKLKYTVALKSILTKIIIGLIKNNNKMQKSIIYFI